MSATVFVQPLDLVKNRMQMSGEVELSTQLWVWLDTLASLLGVGGMAREHRSSFHAFGKILRSEGLFAMYNG